MSRSAHATLCQSKNQSSEKNYIYFNVVSGSV